MKTFKNIYHKDHFNPNRTGERKTMRLRSIDQFPQNTAFYLKSLQKLLQKLEISRVMKTIKQIKSINPYFRQYLNENRISTIKIQDVIKFEDLYEKYHADSSKKFIHLGSIRNGFFELKKRMQQEQVLDFDTQIKYCSSAINRELNKLERNGQDYEGAKIFRYSAFDVGQLQQQQLHNGKYEYLTRYQLKKSQILQQFEIKFKILLADK